MTHVGAQFPSPSTLLVPAKWNLVAEERVLRVSAPSCADSSRTYLVLPDRARLELSRDPLQSVGIERVHRSTEAVLP